MFSIRPYTPADKQQWDDFVKNSKNGTFLHCRDFMEYHSHRFTDHSLMIFNQNGKLIALLPANEISEEEDNQPVADCQTFGSRPYQKQETRNQKPETINQKHLHSHQGLTYGGLILSIDQGINDVMDIFTAIIDYLRQNNFSTLHYKQIPTIYHTCPSQEDEYALWRHNAHLEVCNIASTVALHSPQMPPAKRCRKQRYKSACKQNYQLRETDDLSLFWPILQTSLKLHHNAQPVHTLQEMEKLKQTFPDNIRLFLAYNTYNQPEGGVLLFVTPQVAHSQYGHATEKGYRNHVMDYIYFTLIEQYRNDGHTQYFDLGTSNEQAGQILNATLADQKEGFGARGIAYKQWRIDI